MKLQLAILALAFTLLAIFLWLTVKKPPIVGEFYRPVEEVEYNVTEAHVELGVDVTDHYVVGYKNATHMYFGGVPPGSTAVGKIMIFISEEVPVRCEVTGNISKITTPTEFFINRTQVVEFEVNLENTKLGESYRGSFDCYKPA